MTATRRATRADARDLGHVDRRHACQRLAQQHARGFDGNTDYCRHRQARQTQSGTAHDVIELHDHIGRHADTYRSSPILVADAAARFTDHSLGFFQQTPIAIILISVGTLHFAARYRRDGSGRKKRQRRNRPPIYYRIRLRIGDALVGANTAAGFLPALSGMTLQIIERGGESFLPPFDDITLAPGDRLFVAATRKEISDALASKDHPLSRQLLPLVPDIEADSDDETILAELVVAPGSRMAARAVHQTGFTHDTGCFIIGVQRRRRMLRHELTENRLEAGDVLLVIGRQANIESLRDNRTHC